MARRNRLHTFWIVFRFVLWYLTHNRRSMYKICTASAARIKRLSTFVTRFRTNPCSRPRNQQRLKHRKNAIYMFYYAFMRTVLVVPNKLDYNASFQWDKFTRLILLNILYRYTRIEIVNDKSTEGIYPYCITKYTRCHLTHSSCYLNSNISILKDFEKNSFIKKIKNTVFNTSDKKKKFISTTVYLRWIHRRPVRKTLFLPNNE